MNAGNESSQIPPRGENVFHWQRTEIEDAFAPLDPKNTHDVAMDYSNVATSWDQGVETFARSVHGSIAEAWEGAAADQAKDAITRYTTDAHNLTALLTQMSTDMQAASQAISNTRNAIPAAAAHSWTSNVWPPRAHEEENSRNEARDSARIAMLQNYVQTFAELDGRVPVLPTGLNPTQPLDIPASSPDGTGPSGTGNPGGPTPSQPGDDTGKPEQPGDDKPGDRPEESPGKPTTPTSTQTTPSNVDPTTTRPTTTDPSLTSTTPSSTSGPGSPTGPGSPGVPGRENPGTPSPGRSVPGVPGTPGPVSPVAARVAATAAGRGMPGTPGMTGGGKGKSDEDSTHTTPDYLINAANTAELLGEIPPTVQGGVIGGDHEDTNPARGN